MKNFKNGLTLTSILFLAFFSISFVTPAYSQTVCSNGDNLGPGSGEALDVTGTCMVGAGTYNYGYVNIYNGGELIFDDAVIDFWAGSILIENNSALIAENIGQNGLLTIHLYGSESDSVPISCKTDSMCGVPANIWNSNGSQKFDLPGLTTEDDYFYAYDNLPFYVNGVIPPNNGQGFFGFKVLAVSYGGTLILDGVKGSSMGNLDPSDSGTSWARLNGTVNSSTNTLKLDRTVDWEIGDQIVVTTTDYLPGHSEQFTIIDISSGGTITLDRNFKYIHSGRKYQIKTAGREMQTTENVGENNITVTDSINRLGLKFDEAETRAAVALLSRSIRIVSEGEGLDDLFPAEDPSKVNNYYYGGHTIFRQGFEKIQVQGVEFYQMGQGGRIGRYPVNFRLARKTPSDTYLKDNSIHDSMTRWITLQGTHGVLLERNVGYKSIGHGYMLKDATEIDNKFYSNIGIFARAAVDNVQNPRNVPGIYASPINPGVEDVPFHSDFQHPTVFWISNGWNDFKYNMAAGATTCGTCYWFLPGANSTVSRDQKWDSYASLQAAIDNAGTTPLKKFKGNYCTSAMNSFNTVGNGARCLGVGNAPNGNDKFLANVPNPDAPKPGEINYYPLVGGGSRIATRCDANTLNADGSKVGAGLDCSRVQKCAENNVDTNCNVTTIEDYTTSFHFTETNFSAVWLRQQWFLVVNSFISDVQNAGLTFVTGGDYTRASSIGGNWLLALKNVFVGNTQENNPLASNAGPVVPGAEGLSCDTRDNTINYCLLEDQGLSFILSSFGNNQRLFNIYDGPAQQADNAYLDITRTEVGDCKLNSGNCQGSEYMYGKVLGMPFNNELNSCVLPNAAIAWKQPNGFYYPPSFHSENLFFDEVDIRHFIINPLFDPGTRTTNISEVTAQYCTHVGGGTFNDFTEVDRQTVLNDDDGSLTGYQRTISVNEDPFFNAPVEGIECESDGTAKTSPYEYVTTAVFPACGSIPEPPNCNPAPNCTSNCCETCEDWNASAADPNTYGVPMYRQCVTREENNKNENPSIRLMGQAIHQRSNLTPNNAIFYIDTTVSKETQIENLNTGIKRVNVFKPGDTYYVYLVYATENTNQEYQLYVGDGFDVNSDLQAVRTPLLTKSLQFETVAWPDTWTIKEDTYDSSTGILKVKMNMDFSNFRKGVIEATENSCRPKSFCEWKNSQCQCSDTLKSEDPELYELCKQDNGRGEHQVCRWAGIDVDCPEGGCYGFSFTMPSSFETANCDEINTSDPSKQCGSTIAQGGKRPELMCFPKNTLWDIPFIEAKDGIAGSCTESPVLMTNFCGSRAKRAKKAQNLRMGTPGDDYMSGTPLNDVIMGLGGDDLIFGLEGDDFIIGGSGDDLIFGGRGDDSIQGNSGDDNLDGHTGEDSINGGGGFDIVDGGSDNDTCENHEDSFDCEVQN